MGENQTGFTGALQKKKRNWANGDMVCGDVFGCGLAILFAGGGYTDSLNGNTN